MGNPEERAMYWSEHEQAFVFDRRSHYFTPIFEFYISGNKIQRTEYHDVESFIDEILFYKLETHILRRHNVRSDETDSQVLQMLIYLFIKWY